MESASILIIDDEIGVREGCRRALGHQGFQVSVAEHGAEGLQVLRHGHFDLILLDAMMPGIGGLELLDHIYQHDCDIVCIMITGYATVDLAAQAMKQGAYDFLPKPFTSDELLSAVERGLEERQRRVAAAHQKEQEEQAKQLERARQEMAKLDAIQSRFMLVIVHELRNPAGVIKNYLQLMRGGYVDEDEWDEHLEKLDLRASQLLNMLDEILELAHLKERLSPAKLKPVVVADLLRQVIRDVQPTAEEKGLEFQVQIDAHPVMLAERGHLRSLWTHLLDNAIQYTPRGRVKVTLSEEEGSLLSTVSDTGIGIAPEEFARIFEEFYRSEAAQAQVPVGTGLGLPLVNQIVKIYAGTISLDSAPGEGSSFTVRLPTTAGSEAL
jgi:signal transduction histidine kinase